MFFDINLLIITSGLNWYHLHVANHRNIVRSPALMRELWLQIWHDIHVDSPSKFVTKGKTWCTVLLFSKINLILLIITMLIAKRGPLRDDDCYWDYGKARCAWPEYCEYRFYFLFYFWLFLLFPSYIKIFTWRMVI